jgi:hypothetical protein
MTDIRYKSKPFPNFGYNPLMGDDVHTIISQMLIHYCSVFHSDFGFKSRYVTWVSVFWMRPYKPRSCVAVGVVCKRTFTLKPIGIGQKLHP